MWTTIEECLNPPVVWERDGPSAPTALRRRGRVLHPAAVREPEVFDFPGGHRPGRVRARRARGGAPHAALGRGRQVTFKYGLGEEMIIDPAHACTRSGSTAPTRSPSRACRSRPATSSPRCCPTPPRSGRGWTGKTCAGLWVTGTGKDGQPRRTYLYHVSTTPTRWRDYDAQCVVWQTAVNPVVALELLGGRHVEGHRRARPGGVRRRAVPRPARGARSPTATAPPGASRTAEPS